MWFFVTESVHGFARILYGKKAFSCFLGGERFHGLALPCRRIIIDIIKDLGGADEEPAIDPHPVTLRLFLKGGDFTPLQDQGAKASWWLDGCQSAERAMRVVELDKIVDVDIRKAVPICETESAIKVG